MTLLPTMASPLDEVCVSLDLETTGLDSDREEIIEIGAVKFQGSKVLATFETLVNPGRALPSFVAQLTGISQRQVDTAPLLANVAGQFLAFVGPLPVVGHNVAFDLAFLAKAGLALSNPRYDTQDLASVFLPRVDSYALGELAYALGISHGRLHRALEDARVCHRLYLALVHKALDLDPGLLAMIGSVAARSSWPMRGMLTQLGDVAVQARPRSGVAPGLGLMGLDVDGLKGRLGKLTSVQPHRGLEEVDPDTVAAMLGDGGTLSRAFPGYEHRPQQVEMARAVTDALNQGHHLMVEAGTGVGKSVAYLLPAMLFAVRNGQRVVVSTSTINLQEQLLSKDIPALVEALQEEPGEPLKGFQSAHLKGRANYLCFRRWARMAQAGSLTPEDARMVAKTLVWLQDTATGDRAELTVPARESYLWDRMSAARVGECDGRGGVCFLRNARAQAEGAHIVVVNHALLLSDLVAGGSVLPSYDHLIIDEANHLEDEASRQFGFEVSWRAVEEVATRLGQHIQDVRSSARGSSVEASRREQVEKASAEVEAVIPRLREAWNRLMAGLSQFVVSHQEAGQRLDQLRITISSRKQPAWSTLEVQWEGFNETLQGLVQQVDRLLLVLEPLDMVPLKETVLELKSWQVEASELQQRVEWFVAQPDEEYVYWVNLSGQEAMPFLNAAPLDVSTLLDEMLFSKKRSVVLTSATLSVEGSLEYVANRVGVKGEKETKELVLGSPFDYKSAALLLLCSDMPEPTQPGYRQQLQDAMIRVARASRGGVLGLFTSHADLQAARRGIKPVLEAEGIQVLAQGIDGTPRRLVESARADGNTVLLGTNSLWEGVDLPGDLLRVVVVARLPFTVPSDPVFSARSEEFADSFHEYAVPQAVLRFRQGFGRLIRTKSDRGVVVVLDRRLQSRSYGTMFLRSLPPCTTLEVSLRGLEAEVAGWLARG